LNFPLSIIYVPSTINASCKIAVRVKLPEKQAQTVVLILHGATLPSIIFDLPSTQDKPTMLSYMAAKGYATYSLDFRGYGLSSKPHEMDDPSMAGPPLITHTDAAADVDDVIHFIKQQHPGVPIVLVGFSWGSSISGYISTHSDWVSKLVLLGPVYSYPNPAWQELADPSDSTKLNPGIKSYRIASRERWCGLWDRELRGRDASWRNASTLKALLDHIESTDTDWAEKTKNRGCIRIPTGVLADALRTYNQNPIYDASKINCPTLVLRGEYDTASLCADADGLMEALTCQKQRIDIADATHYGILEQGAERFFKAITNFIEVEYTL
jgi:pimeloyl-ACP methyl ester carboxylesterase